jgi:hypothetical protein
MEQVTYKPGYHLRMEVGRIFSIQFTAADAWGTERRGYSPGTEVIANVHGEFTVPPCLSRDEFYWVLNEVILRHCEDHERLEWFKIGGKCFDDPHGEHHHMLPPAELQHEAEVMLGRKL